MFKAKLYANIIADQELPFDLSSSIRKMCTKTNAGTPHIENHI